MGTKWYLESKDKKDSWMSDKLPNEHWRKIDISDPKYLITKVQVQ